MCVCIPYIFVCMCIQVHAQVCVYGSLQLMLEVILDCSPLWCLRWSLLLNLLLTNSARLAWPMGSRDLPASASPLLGAGDPSSSFHSCLSHLPRCSVSFTYLILLPSRIVALQRDIFTWVKFKWLKIGFIVLFLNYQI